MDSMAFKIICFLIQIDVDFMKKAILYSIWEDISKAIFQIENVSNNYIISIVLVLFE